MYAKSIAAAVLLAASTASAIGAAIVENQCGFPVYIWSVSDVSGPMITVPKGGNFSETYRTNPNGGGVSIKIASQNNQNAGVTQFEYTLASTIWYDISNINGYPFEQWGLTLLPSVSTCSSVVCPAGVAKCEDVYNVWNDDFATADCANSADLVLVLCSGQDGTTPNAGASSVASSAVAAITSSAAAKTSASAAKTTTSTVLQTSTTVKTSGTTFVTSTKSTASPVTTAAAVTTSANANEVVITTYVTSWTTVDGSDEPTSTEARNTATRTRSRNFFTRGARHEPIQKRHAHHHAHDVVA